MRKITVEIYKFDELSEEAQQSAISELGDINVDYDWWDIDGLLDLTQVEMDEAGIKSGEIESVLFSYKIREFDLDRGQYLQLDSVVVNNDEAFRKFLKIPEALWDQCEYFFVSDEENKNTFLELGPAKEVTEKENMLLDRALNIMENKIHEAWKSLKADYEHRTSEEAIKDTIQANAYEFYENGKLI